MEPAVGCCGDVPVAAPAAALRTVSGALVADCAGAPADGTSAAAAGPAEPETEVAVSEDPVPGWLASEPAEPVLEWLVPVPEEAFSVPVLSVPPEFVPPELAAVEPECPVRACDATLTVEPATELAVETDESAEVRDGSGGGGGSVAACACRENTSMMKKIPAARIASCIAR